MELHFLGTAGYHPTENRQTMCLMFPEIGVVFDAGTGFFRVREHLCTPTLDIFLSHAHLDHVVGLSYLFDVLWERPVEHVRVHGEPEKIEAIQSHLLCQQLFPAKLPCEFVPLAEKVAVGGGGVLTHFSLAHPGGSVGYRVDWPERSMAYVTDTTADESADYIDAIRDVDLLVHECYFPDGMDDWAKKTGHSCASPVARVAAASGARRLVLVHANPLEGKEDSMSLDSVRRVFHPAEIAKDKMRVNF